MEDPNTTIENLALTIEYDGTRYNGFQYQPMLPTIQSELELAVAKITGQNTRIRGASRTDSQVHAQGQVVAFRTSIRHTETTWIKALNYHLPWDIKVKGARRVPMSFDARRDALCRVYRYSILNTETSSPLLYNQCAWERTPLNCEAMADASRCLIGTHDFSLLSGQLPEHIPTIRNVKRWDVWRDGNLIQIEAEANAFLPYQIRKTNAILVEIGKGSANRSLLESLVNGKKINDVKTGTLPAKGLCLLRVEYPEQDEATPIP